MADDRNFNQERVAQLVREQLEAGPLTTGKGGGTSGDMSDERDRELTDQKIASAEARTDTKIVRLEGKLDLILSEVVNSRKESEKAQEEARSTRADARTTRTLVVTTAIATFLALGALIVGTASYGAAQFYNGTVLRDLIHQVTGK